MMSNSSKFQRLAPPLLRACNLSSQPFSLRHDSKVLARSPAFPSLSFIPKNPPFGHFTSTAFSSVAFPPLLLRPVSAIAASSVHQTSVAGDISSLRQLWREIEAEKRLCSAPHTNVKEIACSAPADTLLPWPSPETGEKELSVAEDFILKLEEEEREVAALAESRPASPYPFHGCVQALLLLKSYRHARSFSHHIYPGITAPGCPISRRELSGFLPRVSQYQLWSRSFSSDSGGLAEAAVPFMGESITDGTLATFLKKPGDRVEADEPIAQVETDKVTIDVVSPEAGVIERFVAKEGDTVTPGTKIAFISKSDSSDTHVTPSEKPGEDAPKPNAKGADKAKSNVEEQIKEKPDVVAEIKEKAKVTSPAPKLSASEPQLPPKERERRVPMPRIRKRVATRLKDSQNTYAMLTTFNEVDMTNLMKLRSDYKDAFVEKHGTKLGLMSGFVKAAVSGLQQLPIVNAVIDGEDIIYRDYIDISIAVGTPKGLVVPVLRDAEKMNFAEVEKTINTLAKRANEGTISIDEMAGGTFTISNGGVYGSLLSTPIINPPQSAILGMHSIVSRPMVVNGNVLPRPMMYIALTYDHRLIDGREAVYFLRRIKDVVEDPRRLLLDL